MTQIKYYSNLPLQPQLNDPGVDSLLALICIKTLFDI